MFRGLDDVLTTPIVPPQHEELGVYRLTWLKALRKSVRNCSLTFSVIGKFFCRLRSTLT